MSGHSKWVKGILAVAVVMFTAGCAARAPAPVVTPSFGEGTIRVPLVEGFLFVEEGNPVIDYVAKWMPEEMRIVTMMLPEGLVSEGGTLAKDGLERVLLVTASPLWEHLSVDQERFDAVRRSVRESSLDMGEALEEKDDFISEKSAELLGDNVEVSVQDTGRGEVVEDSQSIISAIMPMTTRVGVGEVGVRMKVHNGLAMINAGNRLVTLVAIEVNDETPSWLHTVMREYPHSLLEANAQPEGQSAHEAGEAGETGDVQWEAGADRADPESVGDTVLEAVVDGTRFSVVRLDGMVRMPEAYVRSLQDKESFLPLKEKVAELAVIPLDDLGV